MIKEFKNYKTLTSPYYNYFFDKNTGFFMRWGKDKNDDPDVSPFGPEIVDIEITTICERNCKYCYKSNNILGTYMSFEKFKDIFHKLPRTVTQIAFGADYSLRSNPDIWKIMEYCRNNDYMEVIPNITVGKVDDEVVDNLVKYCGAVAVSLHDNVDICYDSVKRLTDGGMKQVNIHLVIAQETAQNAFRSIYDVKDDPRLAKLNALVFLSLKRKGRGLNYNRVSDEDFKRIIITAMAEGISFGFDSCTANKFMETVKDSPKYKEIYQMIEPCESSLFSAYIDVEGNFHPCSFCEGVKEWEEGLSVNSSVDFLADIWYNEETKRFRDNLLKNNRNCPIYEI